MKKISFLLLVLFLTKGITAFAQCGVEAGNNVDLTLNIYNVMGTLVKSEMLKQNNRQFTIGDLSNGVYMVTIKSKDFTENQRLIIQR